MAISPTLEHASVTPERVQEVIGRLEGLPALFPVILRALSMTQDSICSNRELERVLSVDQAVVAQLLRIANSAYYSLQGRVTTVSRAITVIGHDRLSSLLLQMLVGGWFRRVTSGYPAAKRIWEDSVASSAACAALTEFYPYLEPGELMICGLLHNIGDLTLLANFRPEYEQAAKLAETRPLRQAQREVFGIDGRTAGRWVVEAWTLPPVTVKAIEYWEEPLHEDVAPEDRELISFVHMGVQIGKAWSNHSPAEDVLEGIAPQVMEELAVTPETVYAVYENLAEEVSKVRLMAD